MDLKKKVESMWNHITKNPDGQVERLACWKVVLADKELASIVGNGSVSRGTSVLQAMKEVRALDQTKLYSRSRFASGLVSVLSELSILVSPMFHSALRSRKPLLRQ